MQWVLSASWLPQLSNVLVSPSWTVWLEKRIPREMPRKNWMSWSTTWWFLPLSTRVYCVVFWFSEDNEELIVVPPGKADKYCVAFNPLDGSSNIDYHVSVYMRKPGSSGTVKDLIRSGMGCFCAGYDAYCSAAEIVFTFQGGNVHGFSLESTIGELFTHVKRWFSPKTEAKRFTLRTKETLFIATSQSGLPSNISSLVTSHILLDTLDL